MRVCSLMCRYTKIAMPQSDGRDTVSRRTMHPIGSMSALLIVYISPLHPLSGHRKNPPHGLSSEGVASISYRSTRSGSRVQVACLLATLYPARSIAGGIRLLGSTMDSDTPPPLPIPCSRHPGPAPAKAARSPSRPLPGRQMSGEAEAWLAGGLSSPEALLAGRDSGLSFMSYSASGSCLRVAFLPRLHSIYGTRLIIR